MAECVLEALRGDKDSDSALIGAMFLVDVGGHIIGAVKGLTKGR